jgi:hypothetical protein
LDAQGKNASLLRNHHRQLTALTEAKFQTLTAQALPCAATLAANLQTSARLAHSMKQSSDKAGIQAQLVQLRRDNDSAVTASVGQLRASLGTKRFAWLDQVVRMHVARNLKFYTVQQPKAAPSEGN